jgi:hypothetical protein
MKLVLIAILLSISALVFPQNGRSVKRGIAFGYLHEADLAAISGGLCWWYNWAVQPESTAAGVYKNYNMDFVPMTWNNGFNETALRNFYSAHPEARYLLAFNEPQYLVQANMKPSQVAAAWPRLEKIAQDFNLEIIGPAVNWCGDCVSEGGVVFTDPYAYLDSFFSACPDCKVDYLAIHNYMCYSGALGSYIDGFRNYGKKIWLTEFACWDQQNITLDMQKSYMKSALDLLENDTLIFRYSWFTGDRSGKYPYLDIFGKQYGQLTELGSMYVNYKAFVPDTSWYNPLPGRIEAERYTSMSGVATEGVSDLDGYDDVGWIDPNDWLEYNIEAPDSAEYWCYVRISANASSKLIFRIDGQDTDTLKVSSTGGWQSWKTLSLQTYIPKGRHKLRLYTPTGQFNLNWITFRDHQNTAPKVNAGADQLIFLPQDSTLLSANVTDEDSLQYKWTKVAGPAAVISSPLSPSTGITGLTKGKYTFRLSVSDGLQTVTDQVTVEVAFPSAMQETSSEQSLVNPNPAHDRLYIETPGSSGETVCTLLDMTGRTVITTSFPSNGEKHDIDLGEVEPGQYILRIRTEQTINFKNIIKL